MKQRIALCLLWFGWFSLGSRCAWAEPPTVSEIQGWVQQLGSPQFSAREQAHAKLLQVGSLAEGELAKVLQHPDLEIRRRANLLLQAAASNRKKQFPPGWKLLWKKTRTIPTVQPAIEDPWVQSGVVLAQNNQQREAYNLATGELKWSAPWQVVNYSLPQIALLPDGFIMLYGQQLWCLDAQTGEKRWQVQPAATLRDWAVFDDRLLVLDLKQLQTYDVRTGKLIFSHPYQPQQVFPLGLAAGAMVSWSNRNSRLLLHDPTTSEPQLEISVDRPNRMMAIDHRLLAFDNSGRWISLVDSSRTQALWKTAPPAKYMSSYFWLQLECRGNYLACPGIVWSMETGQPLWEYSLPSPKITSIRLSEMYLHTTPRYSVRPTLTDDTVYFPTPAGELHAVSLSTGRQLWAWHISDDQLFRVRVVPPYLIVGSSRALYCLKATDTASETD